MQRALIQWRQTPISIKGAPWKHLRCPPQHRNYAPTGGMKLRQENRMRKIEEETLPFYSPSNFYPVYTGEILGAKYRVVGKLGFGASSTVWLAWDLEKQAYVVLKIFARGLSSALDHEVTIYKYLSAIDSNHPGRKYIRTCLDSFEADGPDGKHQCLVHTPLWQTLRALQYQDSRHRLTEELLRPVLTCVIRAMDYLHSECHLVHTDIKASNIMLGLDDPSVLQAFEQAEMTNPSARNIYPDRTIYQSRPIDRPKAIGLPVLSDFGLARFEWGTGEDDIQPEIYTAPEVLLDMDWSYSVDIWNIGTMIWDLFYDKHLFDAYDPITNKLSNKYHLAEMVAYLGTPPLSFLEKSETSWKYFDRSGKFIRRLLTGIDLADKLSLEAREERLEGEKKVLFLNFIRSMLRGDPKDRLTARELLDDPWLNDYNV
ncbi:hypothetical protein PV08_08907 [Exophiala spinifera]|uniref:non-specific serine/threonine protein kinase n=1 Tax=Exophiala spinifera TaxID=91928 RepID=A0A0D1YF58_9EURO|nr:uncharacterized protein PV08_08907 [Exophiala spinifera]KIW13716.1 hypothetical protein PV08_08907 [Exophiala spinifera]